MSVQVNSEEVETVIKAMLTEKTGKHLLDSGDHYGRHWEENEETPPWEKDRIQVRDDYVVMNIYHWLTGDRGLARDRQIAEREADFIETEGQNSDSWLTSMKRYAKTHMTHSGPYGHETSTDPMTGNTYNGEFGGLTQDFQYVAWWEGETAYVLLQIHQGCDIRGGYTKPKLFKFGEVYSPMDLIPMEFHFKCNSCGWRDREGGLNYEGIQEMTVPSENRCECPECSGEVSIIG